MRNFRFFFCLIKRCFGTHFLTHLASIGRPQVRGKTDRSVGIFHDGHHLSPGSVLEASFSSGSLDDSSGRVLE